MGTRADFYVGHGESAEWLGSTAWDGYPSGVSDRILKAESEQEFRTAVAQEIAGRDDGTTPDKGWPWPWDTSHTTDYAYAFDAGQVHASAFGHKWFDPNDPPQGEDGDCEGPKVAVFPNMKERKNVTLGKRSGTISLVAGENGLGIIND